jgi:4-hydroxy-2-oxoheptanedioate aldolase
MERIVRNNKMRELLRSGRPTFGTHLFLCDPTVVEIVGHTGAFDYVEFLAEYAAFDMRGLEEFCRAAELHSLGTMIKVDFECNKYVAQRSVGAGFESVLFTDARSSDDVRDFVRCLRPDTPEDRGLYGVAGRRHALPSYGGGVRYIEALKDIVIAVMIEKGSAVEQLESILEVGGVDLIQWGPSDYSMSIGLPGGERDERVLSTERRVIKMCLEAGVPCRAEIETVEAAKYYADLGIRHFSLGTDLFMLHDALKDGGERLRSTLDDLL